ncbi:uncharacterized protein [Amphiura filiformis]|uniref:uncharacterized protein n=1 Tax=Amphiura filiformis TaxID=82378 RepID=UPI003B2196C1
MDGVLKGIRQSQTNPKYLHTNSTSHKWPFSAVAELIDNAYDPDVLASKLDINYESFANHPCLTFTDDGNGLDAEGMHKMLSFGFSHKEDTPKHLAVGQYGNGFKSGSMRLGRDAIVFSNKNNTKTIGFLSQTFLENIKAATVLVPIVSWNLANNILLFADAEPSLRAILKHSIFTTTDELFAQFKKINSHKGTRILIYNLKRDTSNRLEFDFMKDGHDIILAEEYDLTHPAVSMVGPDNDSDIPEHTYSLRAFCSILYMKPKLRIHLRKRKVQTLFVEKSLSRTERDTYKPKNLVPDRPVKITFGFNPKKNQYGMLMYHKNRLIKPYVKVGYQLKPDQRGVGVLGVVECNFLQPTHNKQDFLDTNVYRSLISSLGSKLNDYWNAKMGTPTMMSGGIVDLVKPEPADHPDDNWVQCDRCQKWRKLPANANMAVVKRLKEWFCEMNPDPRHSHCSIAEEPEDTDDTRPSYDKTLFKRRQQAAEYQRKAVEDARRRQERAKVTEERKRLQQEKARLALMQQQVATQEQEAKKAKEMEQLLQKIAVQQEQIKAQEQQIQQNIGPSNKSKPAIEDDDEIQIVDDDDDPQPPEPGPIPLKITKVNSQAPMKRPMPASGMRVSQQGTPAKQQRIAPLPTPSPATPLVNPQTPSQSPGRAPKSAAPKQKITLKPVTLKRKKRIHKRVQVDEEQAEALESEDESDKLPRFKIQTDKKNVSHNGTQVVEDDLCGGCWVCRQMKIKQEIKQEMEDTSSVTVKREQIAVKHEPGMSGDAFHDIPSTSQASPLRDKQSAMPPSNSEYMQKRFDSLTKERNSYKQELERIKEEQAKQSQGPSVSHLTEKLEDSWQKIEDLQSQLDKAASERNIVKKELEILRVNQNVSGNEALNRSLAQMKTASEERDMLREGKADLERRVNQFTKTLSEKLDVQSREIQDDFNKKLREARERAASAEVKADNLKEENKALVDEVAKLKGLASQGDDVHRICNEKQKQAQEKACQQMEDCKTKVKAVLEAQCKEWEEKTSTWKARITETLRAKEELVEQAKKSEEDLAQAEGKYQELLQKEEVLEKELKDTKEKELKAAKVLAEVKQQHKSQLTQLEATRCRELADCRQELQVMVKEIKQQHEEKQQDITRKLAAAQQEVSDAQNKWEDSEKKANDLNQSLQSLRRQLNQARQETQNQANSQNVLEGLRVNVLNLLRTLIDQNDVDLDNYVNDPRSAQVDDIVQRVLDDNSQE